MRLANNKIRERGIFDVFRDKYGLAGEFKHIDSPDFIVSQDGNVLGVEITEIYSKDEIDGKTLREHELTKERIVDRACEKAKECGLPPLHVGVIFTGNIQNSDETFLTDTLFETVKNNYPETGDQVDLDSESGIPDGFWAIVMYNVPGSKRHVWTVSEAGDVETNFSQQLQQIIDSKAEKISQYLAKCNKCWLIIAALGISGSNFYEISEEMKQICYKSPFEKVFFMETFSKTLKELKIKAAL